MKLLKRLLISLTVVAISIVSFIFGVSAYGSDNNIPYSFTVPGNQGSNYSSAEYRGNSGTEVPWKVNFTYSSEGTGTVMQYYLSGPWWSKQSDYKSVSQGSGAKYYHAYDSAKNMDIAIAARNNNYNNYSYTISGYWDEETAKHTFSDWN